MKSKGKASELAKKFAENKCSPEELAIIESWYNTLPEKSDSPSFEQINSSKEEVWNFVSLNKEKPSLRLNRNQLLKIVALVLLVASISFIIYNQYKSEEHLTIAEYIPPGGNRASLTLSPGHLVPLEEWKKGISFVEKKPHYIDGSRLNPYGVSFPVLDNVYTTPMLHDSYVLTTPMGAQYKVVLPDGSTVWLNASSKITFPTSFDGHARRLVQLSGEAFFDVKHDPNQPFIVQSKGQRVEVLGTMFNIQAYENEASSTTTLVEGAIRIDYENNGHKTSEMLLQAGQQSTIQSGVVLVSETNNEKDVIWKDGYFMFDEENLHSVLRKLERWYAVKVDYSNIPETKFNGFISKEVQLSEVLEMLSLTGDLNLKTSNRIISIHPNP